MGEGRLSCAVRPQVNRGVFLEDKSPHVLKALERASLADPAVPLWRYLLKTHRRNEPGVHTASSPWQM